MCDKIIVLIYSTQVYTHTWSCFLTLPLPPPLLLLLLLFFKLHLSPQCISDLSIFSSFTVVPMSCKSIPNTFHTMAAPFCPLGGPPTSRMVLMRSGGSVVYDDRGEEWMYGVVSVEEKMWYMYVYVISFPGYSSEWIYEWSLFYSQSCINCYY